jgi:anaerobic selenocysteine-containing dehydrogenase
MEPIGESLPNPEIFRRLAAAMGMTEPALYESDRAVIDHLLADSGIGLSFEELAHRGTVDFYEEPQVQFETLTFPTPSGRVELASAHALRDGHPLTAQPWYDERPAPDQLRLLSPASPWSLNDSFANEPKLAGRTGPATVTLHPDDARARGLRSGDTAVLRSAVGSLELPVSISDDIPPGVAYSPKGRWPRQEAQRANVNILNPGAPSDMGASSTVHGVQVTVTRR